MNKLISFVILSVLVFPSIAYAEWIHCFTDNNGNNTYYEEESIASISKDAVKIRIRTDYSEKGRTDFIKNRINRGLDTKGYENLTHAGMVWYIKCHTKEHELYSVYEYGSDGGILSSYKAKGITWEPIQPGSIGDIFYRIVCR